jgi:hypothetical protein
MDTADAAAGPRAIDSRSAFAAALQQAGANALAHRARRMVWVDTDFADWPLDDPAWLQCLTDWLRLPQRHLQLLAVDCEGLRRRARFMACYRLWSHAISAHAPAQDDVATVPCVMLAEGVVLVQLLDKLHWRGWTSSEPAMLQNWQGHADALLQRSVPALPVTTLGL